MIVTPIAQARNTISASIHGWNWSSTSRRRTDRGRWRCIRTITPGT